MKNKINMDVNHMVLIVIFTIILGLILAVRFYDLTLDPFNVKDYDTSWADESAYIHNARNKALFNEWRLENDLYNPMFISPVHNFLMYSSFSLFGVNTLAIRIVPAVLSLIAIIFVSYLLFIKNKQDGLIYFIFISLNVMLVAYNRIATLEHTLLIFIFLILGLIIFNSKYSWLLAGVLTPFLFFSKITSLFFIVSIPFSLILYFIIYKDKKYLKKLGFFILGGIASSAIWLIWFIPNFKNWIFMNFTGFSSRMGLTLNRLIFVGVIHFKFLFIMGIISILAFIYILLILNYFRKKKKVFFLDLFLITSYVLFILQTIFIDFSLRRFSMIIPILILMATRVITWVKEFNIGLNNKNYNLSKNLIIASIIFIYLIFNLTPLTLYFLQIRFDPGHMHNFVRMSGEINEYIPAGEKVYGVYANILAVENKIKPYFSYNIIDYANKEENILPMLQAHEINYAILYTNIFDDNELKRDRVDIKKSNAYAYLRDNFKIIAELNGKDHVDGSRFKKVYIYKRK